MTAENAGVNAAEMYLPHFVVKQKLTMMVNRYEISESDAAGNPTRLMALAEQKRLALKEQVTFWSDADRSRPVFGFKARALGDRYRVTVPDPRVDFRVAAAVAVALDALMSR
jgi:hypothetical protein